MSKDELWEKFKETNDINVKQELIKRYIPLVKIVAGRMYNYYGGNIEFDDLLGYGIFGLIDSIDKFDLNRDLKFETYAQFRIKGSIIDNLRKIDWIPRSLRKKSKLYQDTIGRLENKLGRSVTNEDLAREFKTDIQEVENDLSQFASFNVYSMDEILSSRGEIDFNNSHVDSPETIFEDKEVKKILSDTIDSLPEKEKIVISLYYFNELTYKEISEVLILSESRISQLHSKAILSLKNSLAKIGLTI